MPEWKAGADNAGQRIDQALKDILPHLGLRGRRRLVDAGKIRINGRTAKNSLRLKEGDLVEYPDSTEGDGQVPSGSFLLSLQSPYCFFYKPPGLHTVHQQASSAPSLESGLPSIIPEELKDLKPRLLQRLDFGTSGIVAAALSEEAEKDYREMEKAGLIRKYYLALLKGKLEEPVIVSQSLDTANRRKTRVLSSQSPKSTCLTPLHVWEKGQATPFPEAVMEDETVTLAGCELTSGQRHQIRAHSSWLGHPLCGDNLYGGGEGKFILQHFALAFPGHKVILDESSFLKYLLPGAAQKAVDGWLTASENSPIQIIPFPAKFFTQ